MTPTRRRRTGTVAICVLAVGSAGLVGVAVAGQESVPTPPARLAEPTGPARTPGAVSVAPAVPAAAPQAPDRPPPEQPVTGPVLGAAQPVGLRIPAIGVSAPEVLTLGLDATGSLQVPTDFEAVGWYRHGPTPGELGPAVLAGHVDSREAGPAVFFRLGELTPGDEVRVARSDGSTAVFVVDRVARYAKDEFPTLDVYGDTDHAALRLITCGGRFDRSTGHYEDNVVAYAHLAGEA